jgi:hypothetical protein
MKRIRVRFLERNEVRMGSPYATCRVCLSGGRVPDLPNRGRDFQSLKAWSSDDRFLALVRWAVRSNRPGFTVVIVSPGGGAVTESARIEGCCESIRWEAGRFRFRTSLGGEGSVPPPG